MKEDFAPVAFLVGVVFMFMGGYYAGRHSIAEDCDTFKSFKYINTVYECKVK